MLVIVVHWYYHWVELSVFFFKKKHQFEKEKGRLYE